MKVNVSFNRKNSVIKNMNENIFESGNILLIDDSSIIRFAAKNMLEKHSIKVDIAKDGFEGYRRFVDAYPYEYDLILIDVQMCGMNGYETANAIRNSRKEGANEVAIVAMSADILNEGIGSINKAGINYQLEKPIEVTRLADIVCKMSEE